MRSQYLPSIPRRKINIHIVVIDSELKMKLNFSGMAFLVAELTKREMFAIYLMEFDKEMPDQVTKADLVRIIHVLCKKLNWIDQDHAEALTPNSGNGEAVNSLDFSSSTISEQKNDGSQDTDPLEIPTDSSQFGSETANYDVESDRNVCANEMECQENYHLMYANMLGHHLHHQESFLRS